MNLCADCPTWVSIVSGNGSSSFRAGDVLTCLSDSHPEPRYTWTNTSGAVVSTDNTTTLLGGAFDITCTVIGHLPSPCNATNSTAGFALGKNYISKLSK